MFRAMVQVGRDETLQGLPQSASGPSGALTFEDTPRMSASDREKTGSPFGFPSKSSLKKRTSRFEPHFKPGVQMVSISINQ